MVFLLRQSHNKLLLPSLTHHKEEILVSYQEVQLLRGMGVDEALRARGAKDGDLVRIGKFEFEFVD